MKSIHSEQNASLRSARSTLGGVGVGHIAGLMALRVFGLVSVLPVFALYVATLSGGQSQWVGMALGVYGLSQALCQMPLAIASDQWGRTNVIAGGFVVLALGSGLCALAHSVWGMIIGRLLQGAGAVGSTLMAGLADVTTPATRTRAMAVLGATLGVTFSVSMVLGPVLVGHVGVRGLFVMTAVMAMVAAVWAKTGLARCIVAARPGDVDPDGPEGAVGGAVSGVAGWAGVRRALQRIVCDAYALGLNVQIGVLHLIFVGNMVAIPWLLQHQFHWALSGMWRVYLPVLAVAFLCTFGVIGMLERSKRAARTSGSAAAVSALAVSPSGPVSCVMGGAWLCLVLGQGMLFFGQVRGGYLALALVLFFTSFSLLEALLPSAASQRAPLTQRGATMGMFSAFQYLGMFLGGGLAGGLQAYWGVSSILWGGAVMGLLCWGVAIYGIDNGRFVGRMCKGLGLYRRINP